MAKIGKFKNSKDLRYSFYFHKEVFKNEVIDRVSCWMDKYGVEWVSIGSKSWGTMYPVKGWSNYFAKVEEYDLRKELHL